MNLLLPTEPHPSPGSACRAGPAPPPSGAAVRTAPAPQRSAGASLQPSLPATGSRLRHPAAPPGDP